MHIAVQNYVPVAAEMPKLEGPRPKGGSPPAPEPSDSGQLSSLALRRSDAPGQVRLPTTGEQAANIKQVSRWAREVVQQMKNDADSLQATQVSNLSREASAKLLAAG